MFNLKKYKEKYTLKDKWSFAMGIIQIVIAIIGYSLDSNYILLIVLLISGTTLSISSIKKA